VTQRYAHLSTASLQEAANSASVAIRGATKSPREDAANGAMLTDGEEDGRAA
jgi:hypothetical protein